MSKKKIIYTTDAMIMLDKKSNNMYTAAPSIEAQA